MLTDSEKSSSAKKQNMKIAGVQMDVTLGDVAGNTQRIIDYLKQTAAAGATLTVFPECATTGYCFESRDEASALSEPVPGPTSQAIADVCRELNVRAVFGMIEKSGDDIFNAAVLTGPNGIEGTYRKIHLPFLGLDQFSDYGDRPFSVHQAGDVKIGMNICYDSGFPESSRELTLAGAELIVLPTNWPPGAEVFGEYAINTRAMENAVYYIAVNRVGTERGVAFIGRSRICDPAGKTLAAGSASDEEILYAEIDPKQARNKCIVRVPGKHAIDRIADRRPEFYSQLNQPHSLPRPGRDVEI